MKCNRCQKSVYDYRDGTLSARKSGWIKTHLQTCGKCQYFYEIEMGLNRVISDAFVQQTMDLQLQPGLIQRLRAMKKGRFSRFWLAVNAWFTFRPAKAILSVAASVLIFSLIILPDYFSRDHSRANLQSILMNNESPLLNDPITDWNERRMVITITDEEEHTVRTIVTSNDSTRTFYQNGK